MPRTRSCTTTGTRRRASPQGTTGAWHAFTGSSGGWTDWTVDLSQYAGKKIDIRLSVITDWGTLGLGTWIDDLRLSDGNTTLEFNDFETDTGTGWTIGPPPAGTDNPTNGWTRRTKEFQEGGVVTTTDTVLHRVRLRGHQRDGAQRVHEAHADPPRRAQRAAGRRLEHRHGRASAARSRRSRPVSAQAPPQGDRAKSKRASAKIKSSRNLRVDRKGRVSVRVACAGDAGAVCRGTAAAGPRRRPRTARRRSAIAAGKTATVRITLRSRRSAARAPDSPVVSGKDRRSARGSTPASP